MGEGGERPESFIVVLSLSATRAPGSTSHLSNRISDVKISEAEWPLLKSDVLCQFIHLEGRA